MLAKSTVLPHDRSTTQNKARDENSEMHPNNAGAKRRRDYPFILGSVVFAMGFLILAGIFYTYAGGSKPPADKDLRARIDSAAQKRQAVP